MHAAPWALAASALLLHAVAARRPGPAAAAGLLTAAAAAQLAWRIPDADTPVRASVLLTVADLRTTAEQVGRAATRHYWPLAVAAGLASRRARWLLAASTVAQGLASYQQAGLGPLPGYLLLRLLDDLAYGAGVWAGAIRRRTAGPLLPRLTGTGPARELPARLPDQAD